MSTSTRQPVGGFRTILNILLEPSTAFADLREHPSWLLPLLLVAGGYALAMFWYFSILDIPWFMENLIYQGGDDPSEEQVEQFREQMEIVSPRVFIISGFIGASFALMLVWVLQAGYLTLVSALTGDGLRFRNWFCLATWTAIPTLFSIVGMAMTMLLNPGGQIGQLDLDPLQLNNLGIQFGDSPVNAVLEPISLTYLWTLGLLVYGYRQWLQGGWFKSAIIVLLPQILLLGAAIALISGGAAFDISLFDAEGGEGGISISLSL